MPTSPNESGNPATSPVSASSASTTSSSRAVIGKRWALGWGNQSRVILTYDGLFLRQELAQADPSVTEAVLERAEALYHMASIVDDQTGNPFMEAKVSLKAVVQAAQETLDLLQTTAKTGQLEPQQALQLRASAAVVLLSLCESQAARKSNDAKMAVSMLLDDVLDLLEAEPNPLLAERMALNLDWILPVLPAPLAAKAKAAFDRYIPQMPPYADWFGVETEGQGPVTLRIDWKCGGEFLAGWRRRLVKEGFTYVKDGGDYLESLLTRTWTIAGRTTEVLVNLGPERSNVFRAMNDPAIHIVGYDGHSDWGRKIPRSLAGAPAQVGSKLICYLLCCGKQILQRVRDVYPQTPIITTFNSSRFTADFGYSEDFVAFMHLLEGLVRREPWSRIRDRVNKDWYNNPQANYLFPNEALLMARSLDRDHDGQADMFDRLIDFNTFNVPAGVASDLTPRVPETPPKRIVGTKLHFATQAFHTLCHFNQLLEPFSRDMRVFSEGWYDPTLPAPQGVIVRGPTRIRLEKSGSTLRYFFSASAHLAHAPEEVWRALALLAFTPVVMRHEPVTSSSTSPLERQVNALLLVAHSLEVDETWGREADLFRAILPLMNLPEGVTLELLQQAKQEDHHYYAGSRAVVAKVVEQLSPEVKQVLAAG